MADTACAMADMAPRHTDGGAPDSSHHNREFVKSQYRLIGLPNAGEGLSDNRTRARLTPTFQLSFFVSKVLEYSTIQYSTVHEETSITASSLLTWASAAMIGKLEACKQRPSEEKLASHK